MLPVDCHHSRNPNYRSHICLFTFDLTYATIQNKRDLVIGVALHYNRSRNPNYRSHICLFSFDLTYAIIPNNRDLMIGAALHYNRSRNPNDRSRICLFSLNHTYVIIRPYNALLPFNSHKSHRLQLHVCERWQGSYSMQHIVHSVFPTIRYISA